MKRSRYESLSPSLYFAFMCVGAVPPFLGFGFILVACFWPLFAPLTHGMQMAMSWCLVLLPTILFVGWYIRFRPRLIVGDAGNVRVFNCTLRVKRFNLAEVSRWWLNVVPNTGEDGPADFRTIVLERAAGPLLQISDNFKVYVQAFRDHLPDVEAAEPGAAADRGRM